MTISQPSVQRLGIAFLLVCCLLPAAGLAAEQLGIRGDHKAEVARVMANPDELVITHAETARHWADTYLHIYGYEEKVRTDNIIIPVSSGAYKDKRPVRFRLLPRRLSEQLGHFNNRGVCIWAMAHQDETLTLTAMLYGSQKTFTTGTVTLPCSPQEWAKIQALDLSLRLRIELTMLPRFIEGKKDRGRVYLDMLTDLHVVQVFDLDKPLFKRSEKLTWANNRAMSELAGAEFSTGLMNNEAKDTEVDAIIKEAQAQTAIRTDAIRQHIFPEDLALPFSQGVQPYRRGWFLRDAWPKMPPGIMVICNHLQAPAAFTYRFAKPLPPGEYKVSLRTCYYRARFLDNIVRVRLGDGEVETAYWYRFYGRGEDASTNWVWAPSIRSTKPITELTITAVQIGSGGQQEAPPYFRRWLAFDRLFISNVMEDIDGEHLAGQ